MSTLGSVSVALDKTVRESSLSSLLASDVHNSFPHFRSLLSILFSRFSVCSNFLGFSKINKVPNIPAQFYYFVPSWVPHPHPISNIHYTKLPTKDFVRRERKKEGIMIYWNSPPFLESNVSTFPYFLFFQPQKKIYSSSPTRIQWIKSFPPTVGSWNTPSLSYTFSTFSSFDTCTFL